MSAKQYASQSYIPSVKYQQTTNFSVPSEEQFADRDRRYAMPHTLSSLMLGDPPIGYEQDSSVRPTPPRSRVTLPRVSILEREIP